MSPPAGQTPSVITAPRDTLLARTMAPSGADPLGQRVIELAPGRRRGVPRGGIAPRSFACRLVEDRTDILRLVYRAGVHLEFAPAVDESPAARAAGIDVLKPDIMSHPFAGESCRRLVAPAPETHNSRSGERDGNAASNGDRPHGLSTQANPLS